VRGENLHLSLFFNFSRRVNEKVPNPSMTKVQPWRVSMNAEKISRPFSALPLHETNAHGPTPFLPPNRDGTLHNPTQLHDMGKSVLCNQKLGVAHAS